MVEIKDLHAIGGGIHGVCERALGVWIHHVNEGLTRGGHFGKQITVISHG